MKPNETALEDAKHLIVEFLKSKFSVEPRGRFYKDKDEELYFLHVHVPDDQSLDLLDAIEPLLVEIEDKQGFSICIVPVPLTEGDAALSGARMEH